MGRFFLMSDMRLFFLGILTVVTVNAQTSMSNATEIDSLYLEDQFYLVTQIGVISSQTAPVINQNLSYGFRAGFIKDIPLNSSRTFGIGWGVGFFTNALYTNLVATKNTDDVIVYSTEDLGFKRSKIGSFGLEIPIELRFRNSTPSSYRFWRFYPGILLRFSPYSFSKVVRNSSDLRFLNNDLRSFMVSGGVSLGFNTFNLSLYYDLNDIFKEGRVLNSEPLMGKRLEIGLIFYIL
ncbi:MAG: hypothetical protein CMC18_00985 [Flavobacteriaceae bacterium]|nr:hypothetical protein [Flavobacteriaceae bacterium]